MGTPPEKMRRTIFETVKQLTYDELRARYSSQGRTELSNVLVERGADPESDIHHGNMIRRKLTTKQIGAYPVREQPGAMLKRVVRDLNLSINIKTRPDDLGGRLGWLEPRPEALTSLMKLRPRLAGVPGDLLSPPSDVDRDEFFNLFALL